MPQRRFTLRLTEEEFRELSRIKGLIGTTTTNKAVRYIINHFVELNNRYIEEINKNTALKEKYKKTGSLHREPSKIDKLFKRTGGTRDYASGKRAGEKVNMGNYIIYL